MGQKERELALKSNYTKIFLNRQQVKRWTQGRKEEGEGWREVGKEELLDFIGPDQA